MSDSACDVSIVVCTCDRPVLLAALLESLRGLNTSLRVEIIVVDNRPASGVTTAVPGVRWVQEPRAGLSNARNAGIRAASAPILAFLDDDMTVPSNWLEALIRPILDEDYAAVIGLTEPLKSDTEAEKLFEAYGGHGYVRARKAFDSAWLNDQTWKLPLWEAGGLGNSAIRRDVLQKVGGFDQLLGAGTPAGSWEDLELVYRMLAAGYRILQTPDATVDHAHRQDLASLTQQLCGYRRGEVCFCLLAVKRHRDPRALSHVILWIPYWRARLLAKEVARRLRGQGRLMHFDMMLCEILAYAMGPAALAASIRRRRLMTEQGQGNA